MDLTLDDVEVRVLGALIEKEITTPDYYPLSLNSLVAACNQSSNRHPVVHYDEGTVIQATDTLREKQLVHLIARGESRVNKYRHVLYELMNLGRQEIAVLCVLLLRGPQTVGEIRTRSNRLYDFSSVGATGRNAELDDGRRVSAGCQTGSADRAEGIAVCASAVG